MLATCGIIICALMAIWFLFKRQYTGIVFNVIWLCMFFILYRNLDLLMPEVLSALLIMTVFFNLAYLVGQNFRLWQNNLHQTNDGYSFESGKREINHQLLKILLLFTFLLLAYYAYKTTSRYGFNLQIIRAADKSEANIFNSTVDTFLFYGFCASMAHIAPLVIIYNFINRIETQKSEIVLTVVNCVLYILADAGRMLIVRIALFLLAALIWYLKNRDAFNSISLTKAVVIIAVFVGVLTVTTVSRNSEKITFFRQAYEYFGGSLMHMNYQMKASTDYYIHYGTITYGGFLYYFIKILNMLGMHFSTSNEQLAFLQSYKTLVLGNDTLYYNALVPNAYYYYYDSGIIGIGFFSSMLGFFSSKQECKCWQPSFWDYVMFAMVCYAVVFSPIGGIFWNFRMPTVIIFTWMINKYLYIKKE